MVTLKKGKQPKGQTAVFVSKLPSMLLRNWEALGFKKLPKYKEIADKTGVKVRTVGRWMEEQEFTQLDGDVAGAFIRYFKKNNVECTLDDLVELRFSETTD